MATTKKPNPVAATLADALIGAGHYESSARDHLIEEVGAENLAARIHLIGVQSAGAKTVQVAASRGPVGLGERQPPRDTWRELRGRVAEKYGRRSAVPIRRPA